MVTQPYYSRLGGAREVISLEPQPTLYERAMVNLRINGGVEDRVRLLNAALAEQDGYVDACPSDVSDYFEFRPQPNCRNRLGLGPTALIR